MEKDVKMCEKALTLWVNFWRKTGYFYKIVPKKNWFKMPKEEVDLIRNYFKEVYTLKRDISMGDYNDWLKDGVLPHQYEIDYRKGCLRDSMSKEHLEIVDKYLKDCRERKIPIGSCG